MTILNELLLDKLSVIYEKKVVNTERLIVFGILYTSVKGIFFEV